MYSPRINEVLIPHLYRWAKLEKVPMTTLVNRILAKEVRKQNKKEQKGGESK
ncbi:MAG: hypothetical protein CSYNP_03094 [Syntrophus sp. SKADARSKE-3]|nr:hypothetical protein [Syntrophus sp. SKADARSKE-3]